MFLQSRVIVIWLSWLIGGVCGVVILLIIICYCRLMPRHQKSFDERYLKENYTIKENQAYSYQDSYRVKHAEVQARPASYAGDLPPRRPPLPPPQQDPPLYASSSMLDEVEASMVGSGMGDGEGEALKTRSLPAALRTRAAAPSPSTAQPPSTDRHNKTSLSKKYKNRMRSEHAAIIALSKSRTQLLDADAVIVYDQRTQL